MPKAPRRTDAEIVALIERMAAGRTTGADGAVSFNEDAYEAATEFATWMVPYAHGLLCRLVPGLRGTLTTHEVMTYVWLFLLTTGRNRAGESIFPLQAYLSYLSAKRDRGEHPLRPVQYMFNRRSLLATFFRRVGIKDGEFGELAKRQWQDLEHTKRAINRMCEKGRLLEYECLSVTTAAEIWGVASDRRQAALRSFGSRRFLRRREAEAQSTFTLGAAEAEVEVRLVQTRPVGTCGGGGEAINKDEVNSSWEETGPRGFRVTSFDESKATQIERPAHWIEAIFDRLPSPFPIRGNTILALRTSDAAVGEADAEAQESYSGDL